MREARLSQNLQIYLLQGVKDQVSSVKAAEHTAEIWQHIRLYKIASAGHVPFLSHSEQFFDQVKSMYAQVENKINAK